MQATTGKVLIGRIAKGDRLAMQVLYARHHVRVFRFVVRLVRDEATAEDLINEVFLDEWHQAGRFEGRSTVSHGRWRLRASRLFQRCGARGSSPGFRKTRSRRACSMRARDWQSNSRRRASIEVGHEHDQ
jgi:hypothetical protein